MEALQKFLGFDFFPLSIIPVTWNPEYPLGAPITPGYQTSKIQLVVYYQYYILIGWATTRLYVIAH